MMIATGIFSSVLSFATSRHESDTGTKQTGLCLEFSHISFVDKALNNAIHRGTGILGGWYLEKSKNGSVMVLDMELGSGFLKSDFESETASYMFSGSAGFRWLRDASPSSGDINVYMGGRCALKTAVEYFDNWDESHFYWMTSYSAGIDFRLDYSFGPFSTIRIEGDMPVLSLVSRPPSDFLFTQSSPAPGDVLKDLNHDLAFISPGKYTDINFHVKYFLRNRERRMPAIYWKINYLNIEKNDSDNLRYFDQAIGVEYIF